MEEFCTLISRRSHYRDALYINIYKTLSKMRNIFFKKPDTMTFLMASNLSLRQRTFMFLFSRTPFQTIFTNVLIGCESNAFSCN